MVIWIVFQIAISAGLGAFVALERDIAGRANNVPAHALVGVFGCALALALFPANTSAIDWAFLAGAGAFCAGALYFHAGVAVARIVARAGLDCHAPAVDRVTFGGAFAIGVACGYGDVATVLFVALALGGIAMFRPQQAGGGSGEKAVATMPRGRAAEAAQAVMSHEQAIAAAAAQLAELAAVLRRAGAGQPAGLWSPDCQAPAPKGLARRRGGGLPLHNVAIRRGYAERDSRFHGRREPPATRKPAGANVWAGAAKPV